MDAFFASVEQLDHPELRGKPVAVGGSSQRGVVSAASYEARRFGVKSAMSSVKAAKLCPNLIFVPHRFSRYKALSSQIREVFFAYTDLVEPLSLDEAYLDVTENKIGLNSATIIAERIRHTIQAETGLTASAGISFNKFLAKTASDINKPNGMYTILPGEAADFVAKLPVKRFYGIGKVTAEKMVQAGIFTGKDLRKRSLEDLKSQFGKVGQYYHDISRGIDHRQVQPSREAKSISAERTFEKNLTQLEDVTEELTRIAKTTFQRYARSRKEGITVTLKVKFEDFKQMTKSHTVKDPFENEGKFIEQVLGLFSEEWLAEKGIRLLGVGISNFAEMDQKPTATQLTLDF